MWARLNAQVGGRLVQPVTPWSSLKSAIIPARLKNPWYLEEQSGATQSTGMFKAWTSTASTQAVAVESNQDIVAAVNFARENKVRIVVKGTALVTKGEEEVLLTENQSTYIPLGVKHRLENPGKTDLELIEVQSGSYLGEDDIVRFEDTYGRAKP